MSPRARLAAAALLVPLFTARAAAAGDAADVEELLNDTVVTTASRTSEVGSAAPATVTTLSADDIRRYGMKSLGEAINFLSLGMLVQESPLGGDEIGARGVTLSGAQNAHVLVLIDGHFENDSMNAVAGLTAYGGLPLELVDHVEIVLGPGSVLYGANAMLGVVNVVTKRPKDAEGLRVVTEGYVVPATSSTGTGYGARAAAYGGATFHLFGAEARATMELQVARREAAPFTYGYPYGTASLVHTDTLRVDTPSAYARVESGDFTLSVRAATTARSSTTSPFDWMNVIADGDQGPAQTTGFDRWLNVDLRHAKRLSNVFSTTARVFTDSAESRRRSLTYDGLWACYDGQNVGCVRDTVITSKWAGAEVQGWFDWRGDGSLTTMIGGTGLVRDVEGAVNIFDRQTGATPGTASYVSRRELAGAVYAEQVWKPSSFLYVNAGGRFDMEQRFGDKFSPRVAVTVQPWHGGSVKAIYSEAFRGPSVRESFLSDPISRLAADPLGPETVRSVEATLEQRAGAHRIFFGAFRSWWSDMVGSVTLLDRAGASADDVARMEAAKARGDLNRYVQSAAQYRNSESIDNFGFHLAYEARALDDRLSLGANLTAAIARRDGGDTVTPSTSPRLFGNARVAYDLRGALPVVALAAQAIGARPLEDPYAGLYAAPPSAPAQLDLRLTLSGAVPHLSALTYRVSAARALASTGAYAASIPPIAPGEPAPALMARAVERTSLLVGLQYQF